MKVSVVIPTYNEGAYIEECIRTLQSQTVQADEIIVVDNNSTDNTVSIATAAGVHVLHEKQQGISWARNTGFNAAQFDIIARCDGDSRLPEDWIEKIKKHFATNSKLVGVSGPGAVYDHLVIINNKPRLQSLLYFFFTKQIQGYNTLFGSNMAIQKEAWEKISNATCMDNSIVHEDMDIAMHLHPYGEIIYDPTLIAYISSRRFKRNPLNAIEYLIRWITTFIYHSYTQSRRHEENTS